VSPQLDNRSKFIDEHQFPIGKTKEELIREICADDCRCIEMLVSSCISRISHGISINKKAVNK
jgi:hypothetical protein